MLVSPPMYASRYAYTCLPSMPARPYSCAQALIDSGKLFQITNLTSGFSMPRPKARVATIT